MAVKRMSMWVAVAALLGSGLGVATGCGLFPPEPQPDGASCQSDDGCFSETCAGGICAYSSCNDGGDCRSGFSCNEPPQWTEVLTLGLVRGRCEPTCDVCPHQSEPRWSCGESGACTYDGRPWVDAGGPYATQVGESVLLSGEVEAAPGHEIVELRWEVGTQELGTDLDVEARFDTPGVQTITLVATDDHDVTGIAITELRACALAGTECSSAGDCCGTLECRPGLDGSVRCAPPPVCGDGLSEGDEACDGDGSVDVDCAEVGQYHPGPIGCGPDCQLDPDSCERCGQSFDACADDGDCCPNWYCDPDRLECRRD